MTNEFNFGKDIMLDFLGCANLLWSKHTIKQIDLPPIVWELIPSIRTSLKGKKIPSEDDNVIEPVDISAHYNFSKNSRDFNIDLSKIKLGEVTRGRKVFNLYNSENASAKCAIAAGTESLFKNSLSNKAEPIPINEDVSSLIFLHAAALPAGNQKAYFNIPDMFDSPDLLGWYEIIYEDGFKDIIPVQYGVNILEWNPGGEKSLDTLEGETGAPQKAYCYEADPFNCSKDTTNIKFLAYEWTNKRFGKVIKTVNLYGSSHYQALQQDYGQVVTKPMENNAILLVAISKVKKREPYKPKSK
jgi:hypothetical protein